MKKTTNNCIVKEMFQQFCKERHAEDRGRNYDVLQEIYANTELFDMSLLESDLEKNNLPSISYNYREVEGTMQLEWLKGYTLPFANLFISLTDKTSKYQTCVFVREYSFNVITGTVYTKVPSLGMLNIPYTIWVDTGVVTINGKGFMDMAKILKADKYKVQETLPNGIEIVAKMLLPVLKTLTMLPKRTVVADVVTGATEYYPRKHASTIKVNRPIYYVLGKEEETHPKLIREIKAQGELHFDHSFKVRGHWRRLQNPKSYGKNRSGEYVVQGATFINEYVKGSGELQKRIRVIR